MSVGRGGLDVSAAITHDELVAVQYRDGFQRHGFVPSGGVEWSARITRIARARSPLIWSRFCRAATTGFRAPRPIAVMVSSESQMATASASPSPGRRSTFPSRISSIATIVSPTCNRSRPEVPTRLGTCRCAGAGKTEPALFLSTSDMFFSLIVVVVVYRHIDQIRPVVIGPVIDATASVVRRTELA